MPWGDPLFAVPFLQDPETRNAFDGIAFDAGIFERLPDACVRAYGYKADF